MANAVNQAYMTIVANEALEIVRENIVLARRVNRDYREEVKSYGETVKVTIGGEYTANDKVAGASVQAQDSERSAVSISLNKHKETTFLIEDVEQAKSSTNIIKEDGKAAIKSLANAVEDDLGALIANLTAEKGASNAALTDATIRECMTALDDEAVPTDERTLVVSAANKAALLGLSRFSEAQSIGTQAAVQALTKGQLGEIYGFQTFMSQRTPKPGAVHNVAFHRNAFALVVRDLPAKIGDDGTYQTIVKDPVSGLSLRMTMSYDANKLGWQTTFDILYGVGILRDNFGVRALSS